MRPSLSASLNLFAIKSGIIAIYTLSYRNSIQQHNSVDKL